MANLQSHIIWTGDAIADALADFLAAPLSAELQQNLTVRGVSIDTRSLKNGDLFIALPGEQADGHDYVAAALQAGAAAALVEHGRDIKNLSASDNLIVVRDVMSALEVLALAARARSTAYIIAVTGSVGKTSVKESLRHALEKSGAVHASEKSYNNHIGVPLSLARMPENCQYAVFEIGMNHAGEIDALVKMVQPHCAIITEIGTAHIEHFDTMEDLARAKAEIFSGVIAGGAAILPAASPYLDLLKAQAAACQIDNIVTFGSADSVNAGVQALAEKVKLHPSCSCVSAKILADQVTYKVGMSGAHHVQNSLAVLAGVSLAGADLALAALSLADHDGLVGRGERHYLHAEDGQYVLVDESYNANPTSMAAALTTLGLAPRNGRGRRIAVLGDMAELGDQAVDMHIQLADIIAEAEIDQVLTYGPLSHHLHEHLPADCMAYHANSLADMTHHLLRDMRAGDVVMVKGSNASGMGAVVDALVQADESAAAQSAQERG